MNEELLADLKNSIEYGMVYEVENLISRTAWGSITFEQGRGHIQQIISNIKHISVLPYDLLPETTQTQINSAIKRSVAKLNEINSFVLEGGDPATRRDTLITQLKTESENLLKEAGPWIPFLAYMKGDVQKNINDLAGAVLKAEQILEKAEVSSTESAKEMELILTKAREASGKAGAAVFTKEFEDEAGLNELSSEKWLKATAILGSVTVLVALAMWYLTKPLIPGTEVQIIGTKFVVLGILLAATAWCSKIYKALIHQRTTNRHRALGLRTFQAFSNAASDPSVKDAVLMETTKSIFSIQNTGFIDARQQPIDSPTRIIETVKSVMDDSK